MALIPMKQSVTVKRGGQLDAWGQPLPGEEIHHKVRVDEVSSEITDQNGAEVVASHQIIFDKLQDIRYDDAIYYVNELGVAVERNPKKIEVVRDFGGKALATVVYL